MSDHCHDFLDLAVALQGQGSEVVRLTNDPASDRVVRNCAGTRTLRRSRLRSLQTFAGYTLCP